MKQSYLLFILVLLLIICFSFLVFVGGVAKAPSEVAPGDESNREPKGQQEQNEIIYNNSSANDIQVELPFPGAVTGKEFGVIGKARGYWFFEASFPIEVWDKDGNLLALGIATALGEWMTEDFVQFAGELKVPEAYIGPATVVLKKDNPSGLPENDASISFPITIEY